MDADIQGENYSVTYDPVGRQVFLKGVLRLNGLQDYAPVADLLSAAAQPAADLIVDIRELEFLNSSGIAMLAKFVIEARNRKAAHLTFRGGQSVAWQGKSLVNLQRLMPGLVVEFV